MWPIFRTAACESSLFDRGLQLEYIWAYQYYMTLYGPIRASFLVYCLRLEYKLCSVHDRRMLKFEGYTGARAREFCIDEIQCKKILFPQTNNDRNIYDVLLAHVRMLLRISSTSLPVL